MNSATSRPSWFVLTRHWLSLAGTALVTTAGLSWLFVLPAQIRGHVDDPYVGIVVFLVLPAIFFTGLVDPDWHLPWESPDSERLDGTCFRPQGRPATTRLVFRCHNPSEPAYRNAVYLQGRQAHGNASVLWSVLPQYES